MARKPKPWWWTARKGWYANINGERKCLGEHPVGAPKPKKGKTGWNVPDEILEEFRHLTKQHSLGGTVIEVLDSFIAWGYDNLARSTVRRYEQFCQSFVEQFGRLPIADLSTAHVTKWLDSQKKWNSTTKRNAITVLIRAMNYAKRNLGMAYNPLAGMEKPTVQTRKEILTDEEFKKLLGLIKDGDPFRDLLIVSYDCYCRPQEIKKLEARHLELDKCRAVLAFDEDKVGHTRAIYFPTKRSMKIVTRLAEEHPEGMLFRNKRGGNWTAMSVKNRFQRLDEKMGKRITHYSFRRTGITNAIINGTDSHVVARLAGHTSTAMIDKVYSRVADDAKYMLKQARKAAKRKGSKSKSKGAGGDAGD